MTVGAHIEKAIKFAGSEAKLAALIGVTQPAINKMRRGGGISARTAIRFERALGVSRHLLRPDLWPAPITPSAGGSSSLVPAADPSGPLPAGGASILPAVSGAGAYGVTGGS